MNWETWFEVKKIDFIFGGIIILIGCLGLMIYLIFKKDK